MREEFRYICIESDMLKTLHYRDCQTDIIREIISIGSLIWRKKSPLSVDNDALLCELRGCVFVVNTLSGSIIEKTRLITYRNNATITITI